MDKKVLCSQLNSRLYRLIIFYLQYSFKVQKLTKWWNAILVFTILHAFMILWYKAVDVSHWLPIEMEFLLYRPLRFLLVTAAILEESVSHLWTRTGWCWMAFLCDPQWHHRWRCCSRGLIISQRDPRLLLLYTFRSDRKTSRLTC